MGCKPVIMGADGLSKRRRKLLLVLFVVFILSLVYLPAISLWDGVDISDPSVFVAEAASAQFSWEQILREAKKEGKVTVLGPPTPEVRPAIIGAFQKAFPDVAVEYQTGIIGSYIPKLRAELAAGKTSIDVHLTGASSLLRNKDLFEPLPPRIILPEAADASKWRSSQGSGYKFADQEQRIALQTSEWVFGYVLVNTRMVKPDALTSWRDLLKPQWKGKIAAHDPRGSGAGQEVASYLLAKLGDKYIVALFKGQEVALTRSYSQVADWLAQGKYAIGIAQVQDRIEALRKEGVPLNAFSLRDAPGTLSGGFSVIAVQKGAPHPNAAVVFLNWFLTKEGQAAYQRPHLYPSLRVDVPRDYVPEYILPKPGIEYLDTYIEDFLAKRNILAERVQELVGR